MAGKLKVPEVERFMAKVSKVDNGCWLWTAYCMPNGYGQFRHPLRHELAHRASYRMFVGVLDARDIMHSCDTPSCVNPEHLSLGTRAENMQDAKRKMRMRTGETHGRSKLTNIQVALIRSSTCLQREIATTFGISQGHVSTIRSMNCNH